MNTKTKKIIAKEFIYLILGTILFFIIYFGCLYFQERNYKSSKELEKKIENITDVLSKKQLLWFGLSEDKFYSDSFNEFQVKYSDFENQKLLYQQLINNELYTKSLSDFRLKYFRKDKAYEDIYQLYLNQNGRIEKEKFNSLLKDSKVTNWLYKRFVGEGYKHTFADFNKLIFGPDDKILSEYELRNELEKRKTLEQKLKNKKSSMFNNKFGDDEIFGIALIVFSILFLLRYLIFGIKWSIKQLKE